MIETNIESVARSPSPPKAFTSPPLCKGGPPVMEIVVNLYTKVVDPA